LREDELEDGGVYEGAVGAQKECFGRGEGSYSGIGRCEVFAEGLWDLLLVSGRVRAGGVPEPATSVFNSCRPHSSSIETQSQTRR
jgi:hypothetical protein